MGFRMLVDARDDTHWQKFVAFGLQVEHHLSPKNRTGLVRCTASGGQWPSAGSPRVANDSADQPVRVVAHSGISLRVDARHLGDGFLVWVGVFADDIQRVEGKH